MKIMLDGKDSLSAAYLRYEKDLAGSDKYDLIVQKQDMTEEIADGHKRILMLERMDGCAIWCSKWLKHPNVKTVLKMYFYPDLEYNNQPCVEGRLFIPHDGTEKTPEPPLTKEDMAKIRCGLNFFHYDKFIPLLQQIPGMEMKPFNERRVDLFFAGTTVYNREKAAGQWVSAHRMKCIENIRRIAQENPSIRIVVAENRAYLSHEYFNIMADTKVILSPFGWGEFCYRDYEGLLCGCTVVKPAFKYVAQTPDIIPDMILMEDFDNFNLNAFNEAIRVYDFNKARGISRRLVEAKANERQIIAEVLK